MSATVVNVQFVCFSGLSCVPSSTSSKPWRTTWPTWWRGTASLRTKWPNSSRSVNRWRYSNIFLHPCVVNCLLQSRFHRSRLTVTVMVLTINIRSSTDLWKGGCGQGLEASHDLTIHLDGHVVNCNSFYAAAELICEQTYPLITHLKQQGLIFRCLV